MIRVLIVDDHPAVGEGTKNIIDQQVDMQAMIISESNQVIHVLKENQYDVYLLDLYMPKINGLELTKMILQVEPDAIVLIYTGFDVIAHYNLLIEAGVSGFVSKTSSSEQLITAIRCALREEAVIPVQLLKQLRRGDAAPFTDEAQQSLGDMTLTLKEQQILEGIAKGKKNKEIAHNLAMSQRTIEYNLTKIFTKLGVASRTEALLKAQEFGLLPQNLSDE